ncbi:hypothetical protein GCM10009847_14430 [Leucobacter tardus]
MRPTGSNALLVMCTAEVGRHARPPLLHGAAGEGGIEFSATHCVSPNCVMRATVWDRACCTEGHSPPTRNTMQCRRVIAVALGAVAGLAPLQHGLRRSQWLEVPGLVQFTFAQVRVCADLIAAGAFALSAMHIDWAIMDEGWGYRTNSRS